MTMTTTTRWGLGPALALALSLAACGGPPEQPPEDDTCHDVTQDPFEPFPVDPGPLLLAGEGVVALQWSPDDAEVYVAAGAALRAVRVADGAVRDVAAAAEGTRYRDAVLSADGSALYAVEETPPTEPGGLGQDRALVEVLSGRRLPTAGGLYPGLEGLTHLGVSLDGQEAALYSETAAPGGGATRKAVAVWTPATGDVQSLAACTDPDLGLGDRVAVFSPGAAEVACGDWTTERVTVVDRSSGAPRTADGLSVWVDFLDWSADGVRTLWASGRGALEVRAPDGSTRTVGFPPRARLHAWAPAAEVAALTEAQCVGTLTCCGYLCFCSLERVRQEALDLATGAVRVVASADGDPHAPVALSHDGGHLAYALPDGVHVR